MSRSRSHVSVTVEYCVGYSQKVTEIHEAVSDLINKGVPIQWRASVVPDLALEIYIDGILVHSIIEGDPWPDEEKICEIIIAQSLARQEQQQRELQLQQQDPGRQSEEMKPVFNTPRTDVSAEASRSGMVSRRDGGTQNAGGPGYFTPGTTRNMTNGNLIRSEAADTTGQERVVGKKGMERNAGSVDGIRGHSEEGDSRTESKDRRHGKRDEEIPVPPKIAGDGRGVRELNVYMLERAVEEFDREFYDKKQVLTTTNRMARGERGFEGIHCLRQVVMNPCAVLTAISAVLIAFTVLGIVLTIRTPSFVNFLWSDFPLQIEDKSFNGGYDRTLGVRAAIMDSANTLNRPVEVELTRELMEREMEVVYKVESGDIFNMEILTKIYSFEQEIQATAEYKARCLLDWSTVTEGGEVFRLNGSIRLDPVTNRPVRGAIPNANLLRYLSAAREIRGDDRDDDDDEDEADDTFAYPQLVNNVYNYSRMFFDRVLDLHCKYPNGPLRPASVYNESSGLCSIVAGSDLDNLQPIPGTRICRPFGLLMADGSLNESFKNARLSEYSSLSESLAPEWFSLMDKVYGSGTYVSRAFKTRFQFGWPLPGYNSTAIASEDQTKAINNYVVTDFLVRLINFADINEKELTTTFEAVQSGVLDGLFREELQRSVPLIVASAFLSWVGMAISFRSSIMATLGLLLMALTVCPAFLLYRLTGSNYFGLYHVLSVIVVFFIGIDFLVAFVNRWDQAERLYAPISVLAKAKRPPELEESNAKVLYQQVKHRTGQILETIAKQATLPWNETSASLILSWSWKRISWTFRRAVKALAIATATITCSLTVNASMTLPAFRSFAIFAAFLSFTTFIIISIAWPAVLMYHRKYLEDRQCCLVCPPKYYPFNVATLDPSDETARLSRSERLFFLNTPPFLQRRSWHIVIFFLALCGLFVYFATMLHVDNRDVGSAIFVDTHPINRYNEVRPMFRNGANIKLGFAFGLDKHNPVDRRDVDLTNPLNLGVPIYSTAYTSQETGSLDLYRARLCLLDLCDFLSSSNDALRLATATPLTSPICLLSEFSEWVDHGPLQNYDLDPYVGGLRNSTMEEQDFWFYYYIFLGFERTFCKVNGLPVRCMSKYSQRLSILSPNQTLDDEGNTVFPLTRAIVLEASLTHERSIDYHTGIRMFYRWEQAINEYLAQGSCLASGLGQATGFQMGLITAWDPWHFFFFQQLLTDEVVRAEGLAGALVFATVLVATGDYVIAFICVLCVGGILALILGSMALAGLQVGMVTVFPLLLVPGLAALQLTQMGEAYLHSRNHHPVDRVREALTMNAYQVLLSSTMNMLSLILLFFTQAAIFRNFAVLIFLTYFTSLVVTLFVFPSFLLILGPSGRGSNIYYLAQQCCSREQLSDLEKMHPKTGTVERTDDPDIGDLVKAQRELRDELHDALDKANGVKEIDGSTSGTTLWSGAFERDVKSPTDRTRRFTYDGRKGNAPRTQDDEGARKPATKSSKNKATVRIHTAQVHADEEEGIELTDMAQRNT